MSDKMTQEALTELNNIKSSLLSASQSVEKLSQLGEVDLELLEKLYTQINSCRRTILIELKETK